MRWIKVGALSALVVLSLGLMLTGCGKEPRRAEGRLDTPEHHALRGFDFLDEGKHNEARESFELALSLDKKYSRAQSGMAILQAAKAQVPGMSKDMREDIFKDARRMVKDARSNAKNKDDERLSHVAMIRVHTLTQEPSGSWVKDAEGEYEDAVDLDKRGEDPDPHLFMARAYRDGYEFQKAQDLYRKVLGMKTNRGAMADKEMAILQKILRAEPGSMHGRVVAFAETLTRADIAGLFIEELKLDKLFMRGNRGAPDTSFRPAPGSQGPQFQADAVVKVPDAVDIDKHPMRADIKMIMDLKVAGLEPDPQHRFNPNANINRAEFAMMVEDILVKVTGEEGLRTKFFGQNSPFRDVRSDVPYFNAVQVVTSRGLMDPRDKMNGIFGPLDAVAGADALLVIRMMKDELRSYTR